MCSVAGPSPGRPGSAGKGAHVYLSVAAAIIRVSGLSRPAFFEQRRRGDQRALSEVIVGEGESFEAALRRFNKKIQQAGILAEARRREFYERPAARRKRKEAKRRKR